MDIGWKVISAGAGLVSGAVANKLVDLVWKVVFHRDRPNETDYTEPLRDAVVFAAVSSIVGSAVNRVIMRRTAKWYGLDRKNGSSAKGSRA